MDLSECKHDADCPSKYACFKGQCKNPCTEVDPCGKNTACTVVDFLPLRTMLCSCLKGYVGDAGTECRGKYYLLSRKMSLLRNKIYFVLVSGNYIVICILVPNPSPLFFYFTVFLTFSINFPIICRKICQLECENN